MPQEHRERVVHPEEKYTLGELKHPNEIWKACATLKAGQDLQKLFYVVDAAGRPVMVKAPGEADGEKTGKVAAFFGINADNRFVATIVRPGREPEEIEYDTALFVDVKNVLAQLGAAGFAQIIAKKPNMASVSSMSGDQLPAVEESPELSPTVREAFKQLSLRDVRERMKDKTHQALRAQMTTIRDVNEVARGLLTALHRPGTGEGAVSDMNLEQGILLAKEQGRDVLVRNGIKVILSTSLRRGANRSGKVEKVGQNDMVSTLTLRLVQAAKGTQRLEGDELSLKPNMVQLCRALRDHLAAALAPDARGNATLDVLREQGVQQVLLDFGVNYAHDSDMVSFNIPVDGYLVPEE